MNTFESSVLKPVQQNEALESQGATLLTAEDLTDVNSGEAPSDSASLTDLEGDSSPSSPFFHVESFDQLHESVDQEVGKDGNIKGTIAEYSGEDLKHIIDGVRRGEFEINTVTRTKGLREKVQQLLNGERQAVAGRIEQETDSYEAARARLGMQPEIPPETVSIDSLRQEDTQIISLSKKVESLAAEDKIEGDTVSSVAESMSEQVNDVNSQSAEKAIEESPGQASERAAERITVPAEGIKFETKAKSRLIDKLDSYAESQGIKGEIVSISDNPQFKEGIIFRREFEPGEKMVRLYRGINLREGRDDASSVMNQIPYALRTVDSHGHMTEMKEAEQEVKDLSENPSYENLIAYANKARPLLKTQYDVNQLDKHVKMVEEALLDGYSVRQTQIQNQFAYAGGSPFHAPSPYISVAPDTYGAIGYGYDALMVLDVPLSEVDDYRDSSGESMSETMIKGKLDKKYISAVLTRGGSEKYTRDEGETMADDAVSKINSIIKVPHLEGEEFKAEFGSQISERKALDDVQKEKDVKMVVEKKLKTLARRHPGFDMQASSSELPESSVERYKTVKEKVFDYYLDRLSKLEGYGRSIGDLKSDWFEGEWGARTPFDRSKVTEKMLSALANMAEVQEEKYEESQRKKARRASQAAR